MKPEKKRKKERQPKLLKKQKAPKQKKEKNRRKVRKVSIRVKILVPIGAMLIVLCAVLGWSSFERIESGMVEMGVEEARLAVSVASTSIDGDFVAKLRSDSEDEKGCKKLYEDLNRLCKDCNMAYLYTLYSDDQQTIKYGISSDDEEGEYSIGDKFDYPYSEFKDVFEGKGYVQPYIDQTEDGALISAYQPIYDSDGKVVGILGSDYDAQNVLDNIAKARNSVILISIICLIIALVLLNLLVGSVMKSLKKVENKLYDLVYSEGDLTQKLDIHSGDEMELIAENVNKLLEYIREIMSHISQDSIELDESAGTVVSNIESARGDIADVSSTMEELSAVMEQTSASLYEVREAVESIDESIESIAGKASVESDVSVTTSKKVQEIYHKAEDEKENAIKRTQEMSETVNEKIRRSKAVEQIDALTAEILNIAEQTNLLSLNASIEAARAGESGKGFAVVAGEISVLAADSAEAAEKIQKVSQEVICAVNDLAKESEQMINFMNETAVSGYGKLLNNSKDYKSDVDRLTEIMQEFSRESDKLRQDMNDIKNVVDTLSIAVGEGTTGLVDVTQSATELADNMERIDEEASSNKNVANQLKSEVEKFKI